MKPVKVSDESPVSSSPISPSISAFTNKSNMSRNTSAAADSSLVIHSSSVSSLGFSGVVNSNEDYKNPANHNISCDSSSEDEDFDPASALTRKTSFDTFFFTNSRKPSIDYQKNFSAFRAQSDNLSPISSQTDAAEAAEILESNGSTDRKENSNKNILLRKLVSRASISLKPQLKSFRRVSHELQSEMTPLDTEIQLEAAVSYALKDEDALINRHHSKTSNFFNSNPQSYFNEDFLKKNELISKANKAWNHQRKDSFSSSAPNNKRKNSSSRPTSMISNLDTSDSDSSVVPFEPDRSKRKNIDDDYFSVKRRAVSTSPSLSSSPSAFLGKRNSKIMQSTSDDLEKMRLS